MARYNNNRGGGVGIIGGACWRNRNGEQVSVTYLCEQ